jgi:Domain of unknown function (DUF4192)
MGEGEPDVTTEAVDIVQSWYDTSTVPDAVDQAVVVHALATNPDFRDAVLTFAVGVGDLPLADLLGNVQAQEASLSTVPTVDRLLRVVPILTTLAERDPEAADPHAILAVLAWLTGGDPVPHILAALEADPDHGLAGLMSTAVAYGLPAPKARAES